MGQALVEPDGTPTRILRRICPPETRSSDTIESPTTKYESHPTLNG